MSIISKERALLIFGKKRLPKLINDKFKNNNKLKKDDFDKILLQYIKTEKKFKAPGFKFSPDLMFYIYKNLNLSPVFKFKNNNKNIQALYLVNDSNKYIRQQHWFTFWTLKKIKNNILKRKKKNGTSQYTKDILSKIYHQLFEFDSSCNYLSFLGTIEKPRYVYDRPNAYRTDLEFKVNFNDNEFSIIIEYLEKWAHSDYKDWEIDELRLYKIIKSNKDVKKAFICTEKSMIDLGPKKWFSIFSNKIVDLLMNLFILDDKENFVIDRLTMINGQREFSELLYKSYKNKDEFIIPKGDLEKCSQWKGDTEKEQNKSMEQYWNFFCDLFGNDDNIQIDVDSDDEEDDEIEDSDEEFDDSEEGEDVTSLSFYDKETNKLNFHGFNNYFLSLDTKYLKNKGEKKRVNMMYSDMTYALIKSQEELYDRLQNNSGDLIEKI